MMAGWVAIAICIITLGISIPFADCHIKKIAKEDINRSPSDLIIDLSYPLNNQTFHWVTARDFVLKYSIRGQRVVNGEKLW